MHAISLLLYRLGIELYILAARIAAPIDEKTRKWLKGRSELHSRLHGAPDQREFYWFHCASLGEFEQARPLIETLREQGEHVLLSFFSPSGYEKRKDYPHADVVCYLPFDRPASVKAFLGHFKIKQAFIVKYEFWYFLLRELSERNIRTVLVSGIFRPSQLFFKAWGGLFRQMLGFFDHCYLQNGESAKLLTQIGIENTTVVGDTRFDRVVEVRRLARKFPLVENWKGGDRVLVAGSTWPRDDEFLMALLEAMPGLRMILAPHDIREAQLQKWEARLDCSRYSSGNDRQSRVLLIDNIGMLSSLYGYAALAYVGGGFGHSVHNVLEAAVWDLPVIFGPNHSRSLECAEMLASESAFEFSSAAELLELTGKLLDSGGASGKRAGDYVRERAGASGQILSAEGLLGES